MKKNNRKFCSQNGFTIAEFVIVFLIASTVVAAAYVPIRKMYIEWRVHVFVNDLSAAVARIRKVYEKAGVVNNFSPDYLVRNKWMPKKYLEEESDSFISAWGEQMFIELQPDNINFSFIMRTGPAEYCAPMLIELDRNHDFHKIVMRSTVAKDKGMPLNWDRVKNFCSDRFDMTVTFSIL